MSPPLPPSRTRARAVRPWGPGAVLLLGLAGCGRETIDLAGEIASTARDGGVSDASSTRDAAHAIVPPDAGGIPCLVSSDCGLAGVCSDVTHRCVECVGSEQCTLPWAHLCDTSTNQCVGCFTSVDCRVGVCDAIRHTCVECGSDEDCVSSSFRGSRNRRCVVGFCVECATDADCTAPDILCQSAFGRCVQCLSASDCAAGQTCDPFRGHCGP